MFTKINVNVIIKKSSVCIFYLNIVFEFGDEFYYYITTKYNQQNVKI